MGFMHISFPFPQHNKVESFTPFIDKGTEIYKA